MKLNVRAFALAVAVWWGAMVFIVTWWLIVNEGIGVDPNPIARLYPGYRVSPLGSLIGLAWGLVDGLVMGAALAWLYNRFAGRFATRA